MHFRKDSYEFISKVAQSMIELPKILKRVVVLVVDIFLCLFATWFSFYLRLGDFVPLDLLLIPATISTLIAVPIFILAGLYRIIFRYTGWPAIKSVASSMIIYTAIYLPIVMIITLDGTPRTIGILQPLVLFICVAASRLAARLWLGGIYLSRLKITNLPRTVIYGAGAAGRQLADALAGGRDMRVLGFVDDNIKLHGRVLNGLKIFPPNKIPFLIERKGLNHVLLALPSISRIRRHQIVEELGYRHLTIRSLPSLAELAGGRVTISDVRELEVNDLLGRKPVDANAQLLAKTIEGKTILVTGAGGSIGGELCRQIIRLKPFVLVLIEISEYSLYKIHEELEQWNLRSVDSEKPKIVPLLCSIQDKERLDIILSVWKPQTVYHAAAYKHVPIVEHNISEGIKNNVLGTFNVVKAAIRNQVSDLVLISTDKAVRPTNVMGATKRLAEMILQGLYADDSSLTKLSMVRFGNVLASSGSVIPKFQAQIREGGPVTVTHREVTRYFMTIPEAAQLVLQAAALARGGDLFVLDMGEPVKIIDLARRIIQLSGLSEKTPDNLEGDIEIKLTGLRSGEKLYEELLIGDDPVPTIHPRIMRANEEYPAGVDFNRTLDRLRQSAEINDISTLMEILKEQVEGFKPSSEFVDLVGKRK